MDAGSDAPGSSTRVGSVTATVRCSRSAATAVTGPVGEAGHAKWRPQPVVRTCPAARDLELLCAAGCSTLRDRWLPIIISFQACLKNLPEGTRQQP